MKEVGIGEIRNKKKLLYRIDDGVPPTVLLLAHIHNFIRDCLIHTEPQSRLVAGDLSRNLSEARRDARRILDSQGRRASDNPYLNFLDNFWETQFFLDPIPATHDLRKLFIETVAFIEANT
ncbi:MAG: hypothetical protein D084_Lepto4C00482G0001 [Leptospirillum sp. Group IV 'UBA BS']|nr:MAG: hypothetical protein D084_Lepto4C00482G0001 [Leptospirillum sp. Group IV 'UBA BS']